MIIMKIKEQSGDSLPPSKSMRMDEGNQDDIVISGISGRYPDCDNINEFWDKLVSGVEFGTIDDRRWPVGEYLLSFLIS